MTLLFFDLDTRKASTLWGGKLEFHKASQRTGVEICWGLVCINDESEEEGWVLNNEVIELIGSQELADGIECI